MTLKGTPESNIPPDDNEEEGPIASNGKSPKKKMRKGVSFTSITSANSGMSDVLKQ